MPDAAEVVRVHLEAFSRHDLPAMLATMAPEAVFVSGTTVVDPLEFEEFFGWAIDNIDPMMSITSLIAEGDEVACQFVETVTLDGERRDLDRAAFFTVEDRLITRAKVYDVRD